MFQHFLLMTNEEKEREIPSTRNKTNKPTQGHTSDSTGNHQKIVNMSIPTSTFPLDWKTAIIRPLKKPD